MTQLHEINVKLSENEKKNLSTAYHKRETIVLILFVGMILYMSQR